MEQQQHRGGSEVVGLSVRLSLVEQRVKHIDATLAQVGPDIRQIRDAINSQRGFMAGFTAAFTLLWTAIGALVWKIWTEVQ